MSLAMASGVSTRHGIDMIARAYDAAFDINACNFSRASL